MSIAPWRSQVADTPPTALREASAGLPALPLVGPAGDFRIAAVMESVLSAFALTDGPLHTLAYANAAFRTLLANRNLGVLGEPIASDLITREHMPLAVLLDRAFRVGRPVRNHALEHIGLSSLTLVCSIWPLLSAKGDAERLLIEMRPSTREETTFGLQREVAERLLESALREQLSAEHAEAGRRSASFLADESRRLSASLDEEETIDAIKRTTLPHAGSWCVVDLLATDHTMHRLPVVNPDSAKRAILEALQGRWTPDAGDSVGLSSAIRAIDSAHVEGEPPTAANAANPSEVAEANQFLAAGPSLVAPLRIGERVIGAITFIAADTAYDFTAEDVRLANDLADHSAAALDRARLYGESLALRQRAESANAAKSTFLGMMSHELRTPLNAIAGYVELIDMELHGPVTAAQHRDLDRIRTSQRYLTGLINDLLNLTRVNSGQGVYHTADVDVDELVEASRSLVAPLITQRSLQFEHTARDLPLVARGDPDKVVQILVNLYSNAIKFTPDGGTIRVECTTTQQTVVIRVYDTGVGIPEEKLEVIFDPFVQLDGNSLHQEGGVGLGLAISRSLARAMHGDLIAECAPGGGALMTLTLPCAKETVALSV